MFLLFCFETISWASHDTRHGDRCHKFIRKDVLVDETEDEDEQEDDVEVLNEGPLEQHERRSRDPENNS